MVWLGFAKPVSVRMCEFDSRPLRFRSPKRATADKVRQVDRKGEVYFFCV